MLQYLKEMKGQWDWNRSELGQIINGHNKTYMAIPRMAEFSDERKRTMISGLMTTIQGIINSENQLVALRKEIVDAAFREAGLGILSLTEAEKRAGIYSGIAAISGELHHRITDCAAHHDGLKAVLPHIDRKEIARENTSITEALCGVANTQSLIALYQLNALNLVRATFADGVKSPRDWFRPLMVSTMIFKEDYYRGEIGMPSLLVGRESFQHLAFGALAQREVNPLTAWEAEFGVRHPYQS
jgi:hypothetical protein